MSSTRDLVRVVKFPELGSPSDVESQRAFWGPWERRLPTGEPLPCAGPGRSRVDGPLLAAWLLTKRAE